LEEVLRAVGTLAPETAGPVAELLDRIGATYGEELSAEPKLRGWYLDLRGTSSLTLGRFEQAADELARAIAIDDGTSRARSVDLSTGESRETAIDSGNGRLERYAEALDRTGAAAATEVRNRLSQVGLGPPMGVLEAPRWYRPIPKTTIEVFGAPPFSTEQTEGEVLILDFWASWCEPCLDELPHLQALYESERERGLTVVAVNGGEPEQVAVPFAEDLGLTMPIGRSTGALTEAFEVRTLPTLVVVDRQGRVRARWDGFVAGLEEQVARVARKLLEEESGPRVELGEILYGGGRLRPKWTRTLSASIGGVAALPGSPADRLLLTQGDTLAVYRSDGRPGRQWKGGRNVRRLRHRAAGDARPETVLGFRLGGTRFATLDLASGEAQERTAPSAILDAALPDGPAGGVLLGTPGGLLRVDGDRVEPVEGYEMVSAVHVFRHEGSPRRLILSRSEEGGRKISLLDGEFSLLTELSAADDAWGIAGHPAMPGRVLVTPPSVVASAAGHLLSPESVDVALATRTGQLLLVDLSTGEVGFRARWEGISDLAVGDLNSNGLDQLIVASSNRITILGFAEPEAEN